MPLGLGKSENSKEVQVSAQTPGKTPDKKAVGEKLGDMADNMADNMACADKVAAVDVGNKSPEPVGKRAPEKEQRMSKEDLEIPDNEYGRYYKDMKRKIETGEIPNNGLMPGLVVLLRGMAIMSKYWHVIPGKFAEDVGKDTVSSFTDEEKKQLKTPKVEAINDPKSAEKSLADLAEDKKAGKNPNIEKYSTQFVCRTLWGIEGVKEGITDTLTLAKKLSNSGEKFGDEDELIPYYKKVSFTDFQKNAPKGSILIFMPNMQAADKVVGCVDADGKLKYFSAEKGAVEELDFKKMAGFTIQMAFIPNEDLKNREKKDSEDFQTGIAALEATTKAAKEASDKPTATFVEVKKLVEDDYARVAALKPDTDEKIKKSRPLVQSVTNILSNFTAVYEKYGKLLDGELKKLKEVSDKASNVTKALEEQYKKAIEAADLAAKNNSSDLQAKIEDKDKKEVSFKKSEAENVEKSDNYKEAETEKGEIAQKLEKLKKMLKEPKAV